MSRPRGPSTRRSALALGTGQRVQAQGRVLEALTATKSRKSSTDTPPALLALSEAQFQRIVRAHLEKRRFRVWAFPIMKRTMAGVPDLTFWDPARPGWLCCWELKRERRAVISPAQHAAISHLSTVPGIDARIVRPSDWPALRDCLDSADVIAALAAINEGL